MGSCLARSSSLEGALNSCGAALNSSGLGTALHSLGAALNSAGVSQNNSKQLQYHSEQLYSLGAALNSAGVSQNNFKRLLGSCLARSSSLEVALNNSGAALNSSGTAQNSSTQPWGGVCRYRGDECGRGKGRWGDSGIGYGGVRGGMGG